MGKNAKRIIEAALDERRQNLLESEAKAICAEYDMPVPSFEVVRNTKGALDAASRLGFPVVLKIVSKDIPHKTEAGGVLLNIQTPLDVEHGFPKLIENAKQYNSEAQIEGVLIQRMAPQGTEVIIGALTDPHFGQTMMFGLGGVFVEILKDVTFRIAPIEEHDGRQMIREINAYPILRGYRGKPPVDEETLVRMILRVSDLIMENPEINQMDLNPVMVYDKGASIVDARIVLRS